MPPSAYLGTRECSAYFSEVTGDEKPFDQSMNLGNMLFDIAFCKSDSRKEMTFKNHQDGKAIIVSGYHQPIFFNAALDNGIMRIPEEKYIQLYGLEGVHVKGVS